MPALGQDLYFSRVMDPHTACSSASSDSSAIFVYQNAVCVFYAGGTFSSTGRPFLRIPAHSLLLVGISLVGSQVSSMLQIEE